MKQLKFNNSLEDKDLYEYSNHINDFDHIESILLYDGTTETSKPLISITIPCYRKELLKQAVDSALNQDFGDSYEIVIIDNDSDDKTNSFLDYVKGLKSDKIRYYKNKKNIGIFGNWNRCIQLARADYMVFLHADDQLVHSTLNSLWQIHLKINPESAIIGRYCELDENNNIVKEYRKKNGIIKSKEFYRISPYGLFLGDSCNGCGSLLSVSAMKKLGGFNPTLYPMSDRVLFLQYADKYGLYRMNNIVRKETTMISTSAGCYDQFAACDYLLSKAVITKYYSFFITKLLQWVNIHKYYVFLTASFDWDKSNISKKKPSVLSRLVTRVARGCYWFVDKKII